MYVKADGGTAFMPFVISGISIRKHRTKPSSALCAVFLQVVSELPLF